MLAFFDCDGVLLDSNQIKTEAFRLVVSKHYGRDAARALVEYHQLHGGVTRERKFQYLFDHILSQPAAAGELGSLIHEFGDVVREQLLEALLIPGVEDALATLAARGWPLYVVSGGSRSEICEVVEHRGLASRFSEIFGGDHGKAEVIARIRHSAGGRAVLFGDSRLDYAAAQSTQTDFVFVAGHSEWRDAALTLPADVPRIRDFRDPSFATWLAGNRE